jgi:hypothetical protein
MKSLKLVAWALIAVAATELPAQAAWDNVFQPTLFGRLRRPSTSNYCQSCVPVVVAQAAPIIAPACNTCQSAPVVVQAPPTQQCTTNFVQRSFYQPVTTMESRSFYEPVTTTQTSFFWEPVTTMQTSFYPDPCSCGGVVARSSPVTSFVLRQQSCPVQSWVQRCAQVPVTSFKQVFYLEPQTTCCNTTVGAPVPMGAAPPATSPTPSYSPPPVIDQQRQAPSGPNVGSTSNFPSGNCPTCTTANQPKSAGAWQPVVNLGGIAPEAGDLVQGQVVRNDRSPTSNAQVLFVNAATGTRHSITTNDAGRFNLALASGQYHVFLAGSNGSAAYHSQVNVDRKQANVLNLINN